uniref:Exosome complex component 10 homolog n=1 Tax=Syphacia muris TaxID=451379 RepID=A0A0N5ART6_9BILA
MATPGSVNSVNSSNDATKLADDQIKKIVQNAQRNIVCAVKVSNGLPKGGGSYELYSSYPEFIQFMEEQENRVLTLLSRTLKAAGCIIRFPKKVNDVEEFLDTLIEANDSILEKTGILLDNLAKQGTEEAVVVPQVGRGAESTFIKTPSRYSFLASRLNGLSDTSSPPTNASQVLIEKPQITYSIPVDNSHSKFVPKLKIKHHELKKTKCNLHVVDENEASTISWSNDDQEANSHPYYSELIHFKVPEAQLQSPEIAPLKPVEKTELIMVDTVEKLFDLCSVLNNVSEFAVDLEHHDYHSFLGMVCLMQISTRTTDYIIDPFPIWESMGILNEPFTDPKILKVFHGAERDVLWLQRDFGIYVVNMFDTYFASDVLNFARHNLGYIVNQLCDVTLDKTLQKSDWRLRPLTKAHIKYARCDTHYLLHCYDRLRQQLVHNGNDMKNLLHYVFDKSKQLCMKVYEKPIFDSEGYETLVKKRLNSQQKYALKTMYKWRDDRARAEDESIRYVLPDHMLLKIAEVLPREMQGILACCYPVPTFVKQELNVLHHIIHEARDQPLVKNSLTTSNVTEHKFDSAVAGLSKMTKSKALLKCHLDFSTTKFDESIRAFSGGNEKINDFVEDRNSSLKYLDSAGINNFNGYDIYFQQKYDIGSLINEVAVRNVTNKLEKILHQLDEWATPYECYQLALEQEEIKENERLENKKKAAKSEAAKVEEKKVWTHHDPAREENENSIQAAPELPKHDITEGSDTEVTSASSSIPFPEMIMTKKALKRARQAEKKGIEIPLSGSEMQCPSSSKKAKLKNWTSASDTVKNVVNYNSYDTSTFYEKPKSCGVNGSYTGKPKHVDKSKSKRLTKGRSKVRGTSSLNSCFKRF